MSSPAVSETEAAYEMDPARDDLLPRLVEVDLKNGESMKARVAARLAIIAESREI